MLYAWRHIFDKVIHTDITKPLTYDILKDPKEDIVCGLLYIYSMETFVYSTLNTATRDHDSSKILTLGPLAAALGWIVAGAEMNREKDSESLPGDKLTDLYRGLSLPPNVIQNYRNLKGSYFCMGGFTSTSLNLQESIFHALKNSDPAMKPVLMHIQWRSSSGY